MKHRARQVPQDSSQAGRSYLADDEDDDIMSKRHRSTRIRGAGRGRSTASLTVLTSNCSTICYGLLLIWAILNKGLLFKAFCRSITLRVQSSPEYDSLDGRLWRGSIPKDETDISDYASKATIELVVSHCNLPLDWISAWTASAKSISNITIVSKCDQPVVGAPSNANIVRVRNVGRCDHSYVHFIAENYDRFLKSPRPEDDSEDDSYVIFLKDSDNSNRNHYAKHRSLNEMLQISKKLGFACHEEPSWVWGQQSILKKFQPICKISAYHNWKVLQDYTLDMYARLRRDDNSAFASQSGSTLGEYATTVGIQPPTTPIVPVCYGGNFMTQRQQLKRQSKALWQNIEKSLSRANNIAEGHFVERLWGTLLARPIDTSMMEAILQQKSDSCRADKNYVGILTK
mmetsp:Transcript_9576/g.22505  ORF Transcript_9576/g.22505 Transcript_9576/m.22505 type:complete len:401 (+) Transcript_9576:105-1307(+)|eukprot:CAMPEP_0113608576 /NCGR_PEP_ID=MMETSP0017_2-20120614/4008_1 /TAXON_ID=2856 /ORGANISM="Cylindrotheca closterium" /LENGTH=400 /DNA_ID=CAMNT_0000517289 /DNA_START=7 /DNA_END=1209 /DNA_ORIENTATION=- /assembly_acc=CAM_ASM_000147